MTVVNPTEPVLEGTFSAENAEAFIVALGSLTKVGVEKIVLDFKAGDTKNLFINSLNNVNTVIAKLRFDSSIFDGFKIKNDFKYGVSNLADFVSLIGIFKGGFELKMSPEIASISSSDNYLDYYGADTNKIKTGREGEIAGDILSTVTCDVSFKEFLQAAGKLEFKHIIFKGDAAKKTITLTVADKDVRGNSFTKKIETPVGNDFRVVANKEHLQNVMTTGTSFNIYSKVIQLNKKENLYSIEYLILTII